MTANDQSRDRLLTPAEVASLFRVDPKTVTRWSKAGKLARVCTPGGHGRYRESEIRYLLEGAGVEVPDTLIPARRPAAARTRPVPPAAAAAPEPAAPAQPASVATGPAPAVRNNRGW